MSKQDNANRGNDNPFRKKTWLRRFGLWTGLLTLTIAAATVFVLCACKTSGGGGRW